MRSLVLSAACALMLALVAAPANASLFAPPGPFLVGAPKAIAVADFKPTATTTSCPATTAAPVSL